MIQLSRDGKELQLPALVAQRAERIRRNAEVLRQLGVQQAVTQLIAQPVPASTRTASAHPVQVVHRQLLLCYLGAELSNGI